MSDKNDEDTEDSSHNSEPVSANCLASTSRGVTRSSGDYDEVFSTGSSSNSVCSCKPRLTKKPFTIADSPISPPKSKWQTFKNFFKNRLKNMNRRKYDPESTDGEIRNEVIIKDSPRAFFNQ